MSRAREVLEEYRRVDAAARDEVGRLLALAGVVVTEMAREGDGWRLRLADAGLCAAVAPPAVIPAAAAEGGRASDGVPPLVRQPGENLMSITGRGDERLSVRRAAGAGGLRAAAVESAERIAWLGGTLVGDTVLALRHLGEAEEGDHVVAELHRQLRLFTQESLRLIGTGDPAPFLAAVERWMPPGFPRGSAFLARAEEVAHA